MALKTSFFTTAGILVFCGTSVYPQFMPRTKGCMYAAEKEVYYSLTHVEATNDSAKNFRIEMPYKKDGLTGPLADLDCGSGRTKNIELFNELINQGFLPHSYSISTKMLSGEYAFHTNSFFRYGAQVYLVSKGFQSSEMIFEITHLEKRGAKYLFFTTSKPHKVEDELLFSVQLVEPGRYGKIKIEYPNAVSWKKLRIASGMALKDIGFFLKQTAGEYTRENDFWGKKSELHFAAYWGDGRYLVKVNKTTPYYPKRKSNDTVNIEANTEIRLIALGFANIGKDYIQTGTTECWVVELPDGKLGLVKRSDLPVQVPLLPEANSP